ncbi:MAG: stress response translation initiation inhibitor YciH [Elusimicrobiota bacterium]
MENKLVYSTDPHFCKTCGKSPCGCGVLRQPEPLKLHFMRTGKGAGVTRITRLHLSDTLKKKLLSSLKKRLGCGGTVKDGALELQGDRREFLERELAAQGYKLKRAGG